MNNPTLVWSEKLTRKQSDRLIRWGKSIQLAERERIIELLKDEELHTHPNNTMANYDKLVWEGIKEQLIELIKGEQK